MGRFRDEFDIFDPDDEGRPAKDMTEILTYMSEMIDQQKTTVPDALEGILNIIKPGSTENSHDVLQQLKVALNALDQPKVADNICAAWLTTFPWGLGFHLGFHPEYRPDDMPVGSRKAFIRALYAILRTGGVNVELSESGMIRVIGDDGKDQEVHVDQIIAEFREELDTELGPDADAESTSKEDEQITDWMKRWMT